MRRFKVGDRVVLARFHSDPDIGWYDMEHRAGLVGIIHRVEHPFACGEDFYEFKFEDYQGEGQWFVYDEMLDPVTPPSEFHRQVQEYIRKELAPC